MSILVIDVGTSGVRAAVVRPDATVSFDQHREVLPDSPAPGLVEFDPTAMADAALDLAQAVLADHGPVEAVGIANQRGSTVVWDRVTGEPVGPGLGWQDLRTVGACMAARAEHGLAFAPNQSATKVVALLDQFDPGRTRDLCVGTVDTWMAWVLTGGREHVTDRSNAAVTGMLARGESREAALRGMGTTASELGFDDTVAQLAAAFSGRDETGAATDAALLLAAHELRQGRTAKATRLLLGARKTAIRLLEDTKV